MVVEYLRKGNKIIGIGKSYRHNWPNLKDGDPLPEPMIFIKPTSSYTTPGHAIEVPEGCDCIEEVEIAVIIGKGGKNIRLKDAQDHVAGYALALDLAIGNVLGEAKRSGTPWSVAKGLDTFTPMGRFIPLDELLDPANVDLLLTVDGRVQQQGNTSNLIYTIPQLIAHVSGIFTLEEGDVILTGTPSGQGIIPVGSTVRATMSLPGGKVLDIVEFPVKWRKGGYQRTGYWLDSI